MSRELAEKLASTRTISTGHMAHEECVDSIYVLLGDLYRLATEDGCIAAAWSIEQMSALVGKYNEARAELARLRAVNAELLAALSAIVNDNSYWWQEVGAEIADNAKAALANARKETP